jgi:hypothetical protein
VARIKCINKINLHNNWKALRQSYSFYKYIFLWSQKIVITDLNQICKGQEATNLIHRNGRLRIPFLWAKDTPSRNCSKQLKTMEHKITEPFTNNCLKAKASITCLKLQVRRNTREDHRLDRKTETILEHYRQTLLRCHKVKSLTLMKEHLRLMSSQTKKCFQHTLIKTAVVSLFLPI